MLITSILFSFRFIYFKNKDIKDTKQIIEETFTNEVIENTEVETQDPVINDVPIKKQEIILTDEYLGYIEFTNYGIKRLITSGTSKNILDKDLAGLSKMSAMLDDEVGNIIIAGHSTGNVFQKLHYMKVGDEIKIVSHKNIYYFYITEKHSVSADDFSYFKYNNEEKMLTLITCKNNSKQRLVVIAKLRG